jgi:peptide chain release factor 1
MLEKLDFIEEKYDDLSKKVADPEIMSDISLFQKYCKEHGSLEPIVLKYREYKENLKRISEDKELLQDKVILRQPGPCP